MGKCLVASPAAVLLHYDRRRLCNHTASHGSSSANHAATYAPSHTSTHSSTHSAAAATTSPATSSIRARRPIQLRSGCGEYLETRQEGVVLPSSPPWMPTNAAAAQAHRATSHASLAASDANSATCSRRPLQLCRWVCQLASWLERAKERVVLQGPRQGLPQSGRWMRPSWYHKSTLRLQRWIRKLDGRLERSEEELVLCTCRQGLPNSGWGVCLSREAADAGACAIVRHEASLLVQARSA